MRRGSVLIYHSRSYALPSLAEIMRLEAEREGLHEIAKCYRDEPPPVRERMIWWKGEGE